MFRGRNALYSIIDYNIIDSNRMSVTFMCMKCNSVIKKIIKLDRVNTVYCKDGCKRKFVLIPKEVDRSTGNLIDYYVIDFNEYRNILKEVECKQCDSVDRQYKLDMVLKYLNKDN